MITTLLSFPSQLVRFPTPFRKDMKALKKKSKGKYKPNATPSTTIFRKGNSSQDDLTLLSVNSTGEQSIHSDQSPSTLDRREEDEVCEIVMEGGRCTCGVCSVHVELAVYETVKCSVAMYVNTSVMQSCCG